jgi:cytochrome c
VRKLRTHARVLLVLSASLLAASMPVVAEQMKGSALQGKAIYEAKCGACHSVQDNRVGPKHAGVLGRKAGSIQDYDYSPALKSSRLVWSQATLTQWLSDPERTIPGQRMGYSLGVAQERADVVAYLATLK